ncbi:MAG: CPBP family intramembrane metalloprotease [Acidobacteria bacterium]|nr:CPBP family intramembrane metalloprotease [Acidobacteriota bacterium]
MSDTPITPPEHSATPPSEQISPEISFAQPVSPGPVRPPGVPWTFLDLFIFLFFAFGSLIVCQMLAVDLIMARTHVTPALIQTNVELRAMTAILGQAIWSVVTMGYLAAVIIVRFHLPFWETIGFRKFRLGGLSALGSVLGCFLGGMFLSIFVLIASVLVRTDAKLPIEALYQSPRSAILVMAMAVLVAPVVEETIFRGYLYPVFARGLGVGGGVVVTGTLFGLLHAQQLWGGWGQIALLVFVGIVLTRVRASTNSVLASCLFHFGYNSFLFLGFLFSGGLHNLPGGK